MNLVARRPKRDEIRTVQANVDFGARCVRTPDVALRNLLGSGDVSAAMSRPQNPLPARPRISLPAAAAAGLLAFCALAAFAPSLWLRIRRQEAVGRAVVLEPAAELYSGPGENHEILFRAHEGTAFDVVERRGEWLSVKLPDGRGGFVLARKTGGV